jgi:hypothetical protein
MSSAKNLKMKMKVVGRNFAKNFKGKKRWLYPTTTLSGPLT